MHRIRASVIAWMVVALGCTSSGSGKLPDVKCESVKAAVLASAGAKPAMELFHASDESDGSGTLAFNCQFQRDGVPMSDRTSTVNIGVRCGGDSTDVRELEKHVQGRWDYETNVLHAETTPVRTIANLGRYAAAYRDSIRDEGNMALVFAIAAKTPCQVRFIGAVDDQRAETLVRDIVNGL